MEPSDSKISTSIVGLPLESRISLAVVLDILLNVGIDSCFHDKDALLFAASIALSTASLGSFATIKE